MYMLCSGFRVQGAIDIEAEFRPKNMPENMRAIRSVGVRRGTIYMY